MKYRLFPLGLIVAVSLLSVPAFGQAADPPAGSQPPATRPADRLDVQVQAIRDAPDPSAAIAAYARAVAVIGPEAAVPQSLLETYVHRMVQFYMPEAAREQARILVNLDPDDGIAWGVLASVAARQGQMAEALADTVQAVSRMPDNRFVQETAGQVLAWYDLNRPAVSDSLRDALAQVRRRLQGQQSFVAAYQDAASDLKSEGRLEPITGPQAAAQAPASRPYEYPEAAGIEPLPQPLYSYVTPGLGESLGPEDYMYAYPQGIYYPSLVYNAPYVAPDWWWWNAWWPYGPFFPGRTVVIREQVVPDRLFRLDRGNLGLLFLRHGDKFTLVGFDHRNAIGSASRTDVSRDVARLARPAALAERPGLAGRAVRSRIFAPGRGAGRLTFSQPAGTSSLARRQVAAGAGRTVWDGVPRRALRDAARPSVVRPGTAMGRSSISRPYVPVPSALGSRTPLERPGASQVRSVGPRVFSSGGSPFGGVRGSIGAAPRLSSPAMSPRINVGRSIAPRSFSGAPSFATPSVGAAGRMNVSRGLSGAGGSHGGGRR